MVIHAAARAQRAVGYILAAGHHDEHDNDAD